MTNRINSWFNVNPAAAADDWDAPVEELAVREETVRPFKPQGINYLLMCKPWSPIFVPPEDLTNQL